jgi:UPF0716 protein FxsA
MQPIFLLLFIVLPLIELYLLIKLGGAIGALLTIAFLLAKAIIGGWLVQRQGLSALRKMNDAMATGQPPVGPMLDSAGLLLTGVLLMMPGLITSAFGAVLLIPWVRRAFFGFLLSGGRVNVWTMRPRRPQQARPTPSAAAQEEGPIIDGVFERLDESPRRQDAGPRADPKRSPWSRGDT